jgi:hypothetical protein
VAPSPAFRLVAAWPRLTAGDPLRRHEVTGRPLGGDGFVARSEAVPGRVLHLRQRGPKKKMATAKN